MKTKVHTEKKFEEEIEQTFLENGYFKNKSENFDKENCLIKESLFNFLEETQKEEVDKLKRIHGKNFESNFLRRLNQEIEIRGVLDCLKNGVVDYGSKFKLCYFKPPSKLNNKLNDLYEKNKLEVVRQLYYSKNNNNSIDIVLFLNGIPITSLEIKNQLTEQNFNDAINQYKTNRDPNELIFNFNKRILVFFALDCDEVYMTTKLEKEKTFFLPFNKGNNLGKGNPINLKGHRVEYFYKDILNKNSFMNILGNFLNLNIEKKFFEGHLIEKRKMIFPRYHQLDCVEKIKEDILNKNNNEGKSYLIQHSAGSGKSNSIAWLSYHLAHLHNKEDKEIFNSIIVITDRKILDKQLQDTIESFEQKKGVVKKIEKDSNQLAQALKNGEKIIITTIQKFPFVIDKLKEFLKEKELINNKYAIIVDEAHSSQSGENIKGLKKALNYKSSETTEEEKEVEDILREEMKSRGKLSNLNFFGFTATPKQKTLEYFGVETDEGKFKPFHLYSMRQAIEECFILDVLENYTTYEIFFKISKTIEEDPKLNKKKTNKNLKIYSQLHPHNLSQKIEIIVEHFKNSVFKKIGGRAKAMIVTDSRLNAVRYKLGIDEYLKDKKYYELKTLVAFSGIVRDKEKNFTEEDLNGIREKEVPNKFNSEEYQVLIVAEKYQTGFDQPLLQTMYVDKKLNGIKAVQTLSRLNRIFPGKEDTFILDFQNSHKEILESFQPYYEKIELMEKTDPNRLYDLQKDIYDKAIFSKETIEEFCKKYLCLKNGLKENSEINSILDKSINKFALLKNQEKEDYKKLLISFITLYNYLIQIMPFSDIDLEKLFLYLKFLYKKLPKNSNETFTFDNEIALEYYRLEKKEEGKIILNKNNEGKLEPIKNKGNSKKIDESDYLSILLEKFNSKSDVNFKNSDKVFLREIEESDIDSEDEREKVNNNSLEDYQLSFKAKFNELSYKQMENNEELINKLNENKYKNLKEEIIKEIARNRYAKLCIN